MKDSVLHINGAAVKVEPAGVFEEIFEAQGPQGGKPSCTNNPGLGAICTKDRYRETLPNGVTHNILDIAERRVDNTGVFTVPAGKYFFMGDNRDNSADSRIPLNAGGVGYVDAENIIGRAERVVFSAAGRRLFYFWTWRSDRFFKAIE
jgi:signal peptidase I